jgi:arylsulfatase A-like enzyme
LDRLAATGITFDQAHSSAPVCAPSRHTIITGVYATTHGAQHMRSQRPLPAGVRFFPEYLRAAGYFCTNNSKTDYNTSTPWDAAWDENSRTAHWRHRKPGQPFFAVFNHEQSHESRQHKRLPLVTDPAKVKVPSYLPDTPTVRADLAQYYDNVSRADAAIGEVLQQLAEDGLAEDTIVFYYSDNGGTLPRSKRFLYDNGTHVAMIARFPAKFRALAPSAPGTRSAELVNFVDLAPTVLSLAGVTAPGYFQGRALAGAARRPAPISPSPSGAGWMSATIFRAR